MEDSSEFVDYDTEEFYGFIRRHLICMLFFIFLYFVGYAIIRYIKTRPDNDELYAGDEDYFVYRISTWICNESLSISIGAVTLLPFSVIGAEVLQNYPDNYYLKWLNFSLINTLWKYVFLLSNFSLFVFLPFSYFFIESQGFNIASRLQPAPGDHRQPLLARFYETVVVCCLMIIVLVGIADVFYSHLFSQPSYVWLSLICFSSLSTPLLYSFSSFIGVVLLLLSVPMGFAKMFDIFSEMLISQRSTKSQQDRTTIGTQDGMEIRIPLYQRTNPERLQAMSCIRQQSRMKGSHVYRHQTEKNFLLANGAEKTCLHQERKGSSSSSTFASRPPHFICGSNHLRPFFIKFKHLLDFLKYPSIMLVLLILTILSVSMVIVNTLQLLFGFRALPEYVQHMEQYRHTLGIFGAMVEVIIILYIMMSSLVGVYSVPFIWRIRPRRKRTSMTSMIINCMTVLTLSSALPVLVRTLGITTFDLLGDYGRIYWISNFSLVWGYNVMFAVASALCLVNKFTQPVRRELLRRFYALTGRKHFRDGFIIDTTSQSIFEHEKKQD